MSIKNIILGVTMTKQLKPKEAVSQLEKLTNEQFGLWIDEILRVFEKYDLFALRDNNIIIIERSGVKDRILKSQEFSDYLLQCKKQNVIGDYPTYINTIMDNLKNAKHSVEVMNQILGENSQDTLHQSFNSIIKLCCLARRSESCEVRSDYLGEIMPKLQLCASLRNILADSISEKDKLTQYKGVLQSKANLKWDNYTFDQSYYFTRKEVEAGVTNKQILNRRRNPFSDFLAAVAGILFLPFYNKVNYGRWNFMPSVQGRRLTDSADEIIENLVRTELSSVV